LRVFSETCSRFRGVGAQAAVKLPIKVPNQPDRMDLPGISGRLWKLSTQQEKVIRLYFGLGSRASSLASAPHGIHEHVQTW
jgi:hypothetical protein